MEEITKIERIFQDSMLASQFGIQLKTLRKAHGLTQMQVADLAGLEQHEISLIEQGKRNLTLGNIERICSAIGVQVRFILEET